MDNTVEESSPRIDWLPADLVASMALAVAIGSAVYVTDAGLFITVLWMAFVTFVPGYVLVCTAFPHDRKGGEHPRVPGPRTRGERAILSVATSVGLLGTVALVVRATSLPGRTTLAVSLSTITVVAAGAAMLRREAVASRDRSDPEVTGWVSSVQNRVFGFETRGELLGVALTVVIVVTTVGAAYTVAVPGDQLGETTLYLLADDETAPTEDYPDALEVGEEESVVVGVENREGERMTYTIVVQLQRVTTTGSERTVESANELDRFEVELEDGEAIERERSVTATDPGEGLRLTYLLYVDEPPESPDERNAYRSTYLWVDVEE